MILKLKCKVVPTFRMVACYGKFEVQDDPVESIKNSLETQFKIFNKVAPRGRFEARLIDANNVQVNLCAASKFPFGNENYPSYWNHFFLFAHGGKPVYMDNTNGKWIENDKDRLPRDPTDALLNGAEIGKYEDSIKWLRENAPKIQHDGNVALLKQALNERDTLDSLKLHPNYKNHILVSYLSFKDDGYWPKQLFAGAGGLKIMELSCWNWWAGGAGKPSNVDCVTIGKKGNSVLVITNGNKAEGSPFPLYSGCVSKPTIDHITELFKKEIK